MSDRESGRALQLDGLAEQELSFYYSFEQAAIFWDWWQNDLTLGGSWFAAYWPVPQGGAAVRQFITPPVFEKAGIYGIRMRINAEIRGRGIPPQQPASELFQIFSEDFDDGVLDGWVEQSPVTGKYTIKSPGFDTPYYMGASARQTSESFYDVLSRTTFNPGGLLAKRLKVRMRVGTVGHYGYTGLLTISASPSFTVYPRSDTDATLRRCSVQLGTQKLYTDVLVPGRWYELQVVIVPGLGNSYVTINDLTGATVTTVYFFTALNMENLGSPTAISVQQWGDPYDLDDIRAYTNSL